MMKKLSGQSISGFYVKPADYHLFIHTADKMVAIRNDDKAFLNEDEGKITMKELLVKYTELQVQGSWELYTNSINEI
jgi:hypothetical protein